MIRQALLAIAIPDGPDSSIGHLNKEQQNDFRAFASIVLTQILNGQFQFFFSEIARSNTEAFNKLIKGMLAGCLHHFEKNNTTAFSAAEIEQVVGQELERAMAEELLNSIPDDGLTH